MSKNEKLEEMECLQRQTLPLPRHEKEPLLSIYTNLTTSYM